MTEIDPYPVSELQSRYNIGKQAVYNRLDALKIKPEKEGNRSYITSEQLELLDDLHDHITAGGTMADFHASPMEFSLNRVDTVNKSSGLNEMPSGLSKRMI
jgi:UDP-N-acetylmuramyl tripeptide synthase